MGRPQMEPPPHGTRARYTSRRHQCSCHLCRAANRAYAEGYRHALRVDATPSSPPAQVPLPRRMWTPAQIRRDAR